MPSRAARIRERLAELNPDARLADGFDDALIGIVRQFNRYLALYDYTRCCDVLVARAAEHGALDDEPDLPAVEYMEHNVVGAWVGENTPMFLLDTEEE